MPTLDFQGRTVLITGGTRGIGAALADAFEASGASLVLTGTPADEVARCEQDARRSGLSRRYVHVDFTEPPGFAAFLSELAEWPVDVLVNNAGVNRIQRTEEAEAADYDWMTAVNLRAPFLCSRAVVPGMVRRGWGRIVNVASIWGVITKPGRVVYTITKHGLVGMTKTLAVEFAAHGVLVNAVSPGFTRTALTDSTLGAEEQAALASQVPARRFATPDEIARVVLFLASDLNTYLTGQNVVVDGGFTCV